MRWMCLVGLVAACSAEPQPKSEECPYALWEPVEARTSDPTLDEFLEAVPDVFQSVRVIEETVRVGCAAIAHDLGGDVVGLDQSQACDVAGGLVEDVVAQNGGVVFECGGSAVVPLDWYGAASDSAKVDALVATLNAHLGEIQVEAEAAEEQEEVAVDAQDSVVALGTGGRPSLAADELDCLVQGLDVFSDAVDTCDCIGQDTRRLENAIPCGPPAPTECPYDLGGPFEADTGDSDLDAYLEAAPAVSATVGTIAEDLRAGCAAIVEGLGGDPGGLPPIDACESAVSLVDEIVRANPEVYFMGSLKAGGTIAWTGLTKDGARLDTLVDVLNQHLGGVLQAGDTARIEADVAGDLVLRDLGALDGSDANCAGLARSIFADSAEWSASMAFASEGFYTTLGLAR